MIEMLFFIRFRGQLRRTRPELIGSLEDMVAAAASEAGARVETRAKVLAASFNEDRIGFWLDILLFLERAQKALEKAAPELYDYALVMGRNFPETSIRKLCLSLAGSSGKDDSRGRRGSLNRSGIWCSKEIVGALEFYMEFGRESDGFRELQNCKLFDSKTYPNQKNQAAKFVLKANAPPLLKAAEFIGTRNEVYQYSRDILGDVPPLVICFGTGGHGQICFTDAFTPQIRSFITTAVASETAVSEETVEKLDSAHSLLFRERLRGSWSAYVTNQNRSFISILLKAYLAAAKTKGANGVLILENILLADAAAAEVFLDVYSSLDDREGLLMLAAADGPSKKDVSRGFSPRDMPQDLWEMAYNIFLFGCYFPGYLFPQLFEEQGLNRDIYFRSLQMLTALGVFTRDNPRPIIPGFAGLAEKALKNRKEKILRAVRGRILSWTISGRIKSCFNLLGILSELGERATDALVLKCFRADVLNGNSVEIEEALEDGSFASLVGAGNAPILEYIFKTLNALTRGRNEDIQQEFMKPVPPLTLEDGKPCYSGYQAQIQANLAAFFIGNRNIDAASETIRKAILLNRDLGENAIPAYRLFALVHLSKQRVIDALEYISFAQEHAERAEQYEELVFTYYFASSINLLYGNLSKAERFAGKAEETARKLGQAEWEMRARFFRGRIVFEAGRYEDALELFESIDTDQNIIRAWVYRTKTFLGHSVSYDAAGPDAEVFEIEAAYFSADYNKTIALADNALSSAKETNFDFFFTEQPDWNSGFSQCENIFQSGKATGAKLAWVYRAMAQCALNPSQELKAEILGSMQRFVRKLLSDTEINETFYFYAWFCMLRDSGATPMDMNTVVSMAFQRLQRRAGRIDDRETKQTFLARSRWSSTLYNAARDHKLI